MEGIIECAVVGVLDEEMGDEEIKVYIVREADSAITEPDVALWCAERLAYFKVPRFVEIVEVLPRSGAKNEIERHRLREMGRGDSWDSRTIAGEEVRKGRTSKNQCSLPSGGGVPLPQG
jgi:crotonobetaine/carnitine-CoA ligase